MTLEERIKERVANDEALRSRLAQCKDEEEAKKLVLDGMELSEDDLEKIDGGVIWAEL